MAGYLGRTIGQPRSFARGRREAKAAVLRDVGHDVKSVLGLPDIKKWINDRAAGMLFCNSCFKPESGMQGTKMKICARCKNFGREIRYCGRYVLKIPNFFFVLTQFFNRDCQRADWKEHKRECGKLLGTFSARYFGFVRVD
jgi:hypothetical protein